MDKVKVKRWDVYERSAHVDTVTYPATATQSEVCIALDATGRYMWGFSVSPSSFKPILEGEANA